MSVIIHKFTLLIFTDKKRIWVLPSTKYWINQNTLIEFIECDVFSWKII